MTLRGYREGDHRDIDALYALDVECFDPPFRFTRAAMLRFAGAKRARVVVAEEQGLVVGFCIVHLERAGAERVGYVVTLDVAAAHRRRGVAQAVMAEIERQCAAVGCSAMVLHVFTGNTAARGFYARCGFALASVAADFYGVGLDAEVWSKSLAS
jgi:ribosomal-protein-alanine N-acetyltransferase